MKKCLIIFAITASLFAKEVIDNVGNKVIVKDNIKRVLIARKPIVATFALFDGNIKKIVGVQKGAISFAKGSILEKKFPGILNLNTDFDTLDGINIEAVLKQNPDVILYPAEKKVIADRLMEAKLPMVGFDTKGYNYDNILIFEKWQELLGSLLNKNQNSKNIINYAKEVQNEIALKIKDAKFMPKAIFIRKYGAGQIVLAGKNQFSHFWQMQTGGLDSVDFDGTKSVSSEALLALDPDIIYITNFTSLMPNDFYNNNIKGYDVSALRAVKNKKVYKIPFGFYDFYPPAAEVPIALFWFAKHNQDAIFKDLDLNKLTANFYKKYYNLNLNAKEIANIYKQK